MMKNLLLGVALLLSWKGYAEKERPELDYRGALVDLYQATVIRDVEQAERRGLRAVKAGQRVALTYGRNEAYSRWARLEDHYADYFLKINDRVRAHSKNPPSSKSDIQYLVAVAEGAMDVAQKLERDWQRDLSLFSNMENIRSKMKQAINEE